MGTFVADGSPAIVVWRWGEGSATYAGFLPGLSYFKSSIPLRPVDRGATDESMSQGRLITMVNWAGRPLKKISITFPQSAAAKDVTLASGRPVARLGPAEP